MLSTGIQSPGKSCCSHSKTVRPQLPPDASRVANASAEFSGVVRAATHDLEYVPLLRFQSNRISPHGATGLTLNRSFTPRLPPLRHYHWFKVRRIRNAQSHYQLNCALLPGPAPDAHPSSVALRCNLKLFYNHYTLPTDPAHHKHTNQVW